MGCWGITAFESDTGLDAVGVIRKILPESGKLELRELVSAVRVDEWATPAAALGHSHTGPMAITEILQKYLTQDTGGLDYDEDWAADDNKFSRITSFTADKESVGWLRAYLSDTLKYALENAKFRAGLGGAEENKWGGWFKKSDWHSWQKHMTELVGTLDSLIASPETQIELIQPPEQENGFVMDEIT